MQYNLSRHEIIELLNSDGAELFKSAAQVCKKYKGNTVFVRGLLEFSNICKRNCFYCGLRSENSSIKRYRLSFDEIMDVVKKAVASGYKTIVLQSGEDSYFDTEKIVDIVSDVKKYDVAVTLSIGERSFDDYKAFKDAGADRYLLKIETTDKALYKKLHPNMDFENRVECIKNLKKLGFETGTGNIVGLAGQTVESLADDILFFKETDADMIGVGVFISHPDTPLKGSAAGSFELALKVMAITRLMMPNINIPATTAMETIHPNGRIIALLSGANVVMNNLNYNPNYEIYPNKANCSVDFESIGKIGV